LFGTRADRRTAHCCVRAAQSARSVSPPHHRAGRRAIAAEFRAALASGPAGRRPGPEDPFRRVTADGTAPRIVRRPSMVPQSAHPARD
jgi:hypothetical protein